MPVIAVDNVAKLATLFRTVVRNREHWILVGDSPTGGAVIMELLRTALAAKDWTGTTLFGNVNYVDTPCGVRGRIRHLAIQRTHVGPDDLAESLLQHGARFDPTEWAYGRIVITESDGGARFLRRFLAAVEQGAVYDPKPALN